MITFFFRRPPAAFPSSISLPFAVFTLISMFLSLASAPNALSRRALPDYPIISCYSCASEEYEPLFLRSSSVHLFGQPLLFDRLCDSKMDLASFGSTIPCDSNCVSVMEPQFFGGIQNERKPFTFVRGCATDVFALAITSTGNSNSAEGMPAEIEYLQRESFCLELAIDQIWPGLGSSNSREMVRVCSCGTDGCNTHERAEDAANGSGERRRPMMIGHHRMAPLMLLSLLNIVIIHGISQIGLKRF